MALTNKDNFQNEYYSHAGTDSSYHVASYDRHKKQKQAHARAAAPPSGRYVNTDEHLYDRVMLSNRALVEQEWARMNQQRARTERKLAQTNELARKEQFEFLGLAELVRNNLLMNLVFQFMVTLMRIMYGAGWFMAGLTKITGKEGEISWFRYPNQFLTEYFHTALAKPNVPEFYKLFIEYFCLNNVSLFNWSIPLVQIVVGLMLVVGFRTVPSILFCLFMHVNFILSGNINIISLTLYTSAFCLFLNLRYAYNFSLDRYFRREHLRL